MVTRTEPLRIKVKERVRSLQPTVHQILVWGRTARPLEDGYLEDFSQATGGQSHIRAANECGPEAGVAEESTDSSEEPTDIRRSAKRMQQLTRT